MSTSFRIEVYPKHDDNLDYCTEEGIAPSHYYPTHTEYVTFHNVKVLDMLINALWNVYPRYKNEDYDKVSDDHQFIKLNYSMYKHIMKNFIDNKGNKIYTKKKHSEDYERVYNKLNELFWEYICYDTTENDVYLVVFDY